MIRCPYCNKTLSPQKLENHIRVCAKTPDKDRQCCVCENMIDLYIPGRGNTKICLQRRFFFIPLEPGESSLKKRESVVLPIFINNKKITLIEQYMQLECGKFKYVPKK